MNNLAFVGLAILSISLFASIGVSIWGTAQAQLTQADQNGNTDPDATNSTSLRTDDIEQQLYAQLDAAILAAYEDDTPTLLRTLSQIAEGLSAINSPANNGTSPADNRETPAANSNQTAALSLNQSTTAGETSNTNTTFSTTGTGDNASSEPINPFDIF